MILRRPRLWSITRSAGARTFTRRGFVGPGGGGGGGAGSSTFELPVSIPAPVAETFTLRGYCAVAGTITSLKGLKTSAGTASVSLKVDGSVVAGPYIVSTIPQNPTLSIPVAVGSVVELVINSVSGAAGLGLTLLGVNGVSTTGPELTISIPTPVAGQQTIRGFAGRAGKLTAIKRAKVLSGTATISLLVDGSPVAGSSLTLSSTPQDIDLNTLLSIGSSIDLIIGGSGASGLGFTLLGTNT